MSRSHPATDSATPAAGRSVVWHTAGSGKSNTVAWLFLAARRAGAPQVGKWQRALRERLSLLQEIRHLDRQSPARSDHSDLEAGLRDLLERVPTPLAEAPPTPNLPTILFARGYEASLACCAPPSLVDDLPLPPGMEDDAEWVSAALSVLTLAALVVSGRLVLALRVGPPPLGYVPPTWACACGPKRLAAPLVPRGPSAPPLSDVRLRGHRSGLGRSGLVLAA